MELLYLCAFAFLAGFVDAIVGGGGLIQLPALLIFLPKPWSDSIPLVFGTNKFSSVWGTGAAALQYAFGARAGASAVRIPIPWRTLVPSALTAFLFSAIGARCVQGISSGFLKPIVLVLLVLVAVYTYLRRDFGHLHAPRFLSHHERLAGLAVGATLGFYDGFFGPGTGSFLIFIFIGLFQFDFLTASASAKFINLATNIAAVAVFAMAGQILWAYALPMAASNVAGSLVGARLAILKGNRFVRVFFLLMVAAMIARFGWDLIP